MSDENQAYFEAFPNWLRALADDAVALAGILGAESTPTTSRRALAGGLNYLFKSLDLIPDGSSWPEAVQLAKRFSTDDSGRFVNGVLSAIAPTATTSTSRGRAAMARRLQASGSLLTASRATAAMARPPVA